MWVVKFIGSCIYPSDVDKLEKANTERELNIKAQQMRKIDMSSTLSHIKEFDTNDIHSGEMNLVNNI